MSVVFLGNDFGSFDIYFDVVGVIENMYSIFF